MLNEVVVRDSNVARSDVALGRSIVFANGEQFENLSGSKSMSGITFLMDSIVSSWDSSSPTSASSQSSAMPEHRRRTNLPKDFDC